MNMISCQTILKEIILDKSLLNRLVSEYEIVAIYHLAALLSTRAEFTPVAAHQVNVEGTMGLIQLSAEQSEWRGDPVLFIFPSSIAAYGIPDLETKAPVPSRSRMGMELPHHYVRVQQTLL